jgi:hypothetical protein
MHLATARAVIDWGSNTDATDLRNLCEKFCQEYVICWNGS